MKTLVFVFTGLSFFFNVSCSRPIEGCTDPLSLNFNPRATLNDGSCIYEALTVYPDTSFPLSVVLSETSGLIHWEGFLWTHNDDTDTRIYKLDTLHAEIVGEYQLEGVKNSEWEEISQDEHYLYLGDVGNNASGNRTDLHILRIDKRFLHSRQGGIDTIWFSYSDQHAFDPLGPNQTDFDCEAFIVSGDRIFLFTKQWTGGMTAVYSLPKVPGRYVAGRVDQFDVRGLVTGATYMESQKLLVLCGYNSVLQPFIYLLYDFRELHFFSGNKRKLALALPFHQVEGISTPDGLSYYLSNESFDMNASIQSAQKLHRFDLSPYLKDYLNPGKQEDTPGQ